MKSVFFTGLLLATVIFSGCTIGGSGNDGGVYKSIDEGKTFEQKVKINDQSSIANTDILALEIDPNNTETIYIGTKEDGVLRSTDGAETWVRDINNFTQVSSILINPFDSQNIYIAALKDGRGKVLRTSNGGEKWDEVYTERTVGSRVTAMAMDKNNPAIIYIGTTQGGVFKTYDGGESWQPCIWTKSAVRQIQLDNLDTSTVYIGTSNTGALISRNGGQDFTVIVKSGPIYALKTHPYKQGFVYLCSKNGLQKSDDFGATFSVLKTLVKDEQIATRGFAINPQDYSQIYFSSGKAFYRSLNGGETWSPVQFNIDRSIEVIAVNPQNPDIIYLGANNRSGGGFQFFPSF